MLSTRDSLSSSARTRETDCTHTTPKRWTALTSFTICSAKDDYLAAVRNMSINVFDNSFVFPNVMFLPTGGVKIDWSKCLEQGKLRAVLQEIAQNIPKLPISISLHSMRRGGAFYRIFVSPQRRYDFQELLAWCRWEDAKTCCEYLITHSISRQLDPRNLLRDKGSQQFKSPDSSHASRIDVDTLSDAIAKRLKESGTPLPTTKNTQQPRALTKKQGTLDAFVAIKNIPTARNGREAWDQWHHANPKAGLFCALKDFTPEMIKLDRRKYSERQVLGVAFKNFQSYDQFEAVYEGYTNTYTCLVREVRKRKRESILS
ncbi:hypothetical protein AeMF1_001294 [Aphanomyces euteiches]|nr:hypothetical protein AeMF1_001294 [Aphanomyces euteiches]KAH9188733.1 hypothetical protein AeNC1_009288 [Aphanomyces euteiches]